MTRPPESTSSVAISLAAHTAECIGSTYSEGTMRTRSVTAAAADSSTRMSQV